MHKTLSHEVPQEEQVMWCIDIFHHHYNASNRKPTTYYLCAIHQRKPRKNFKVLLQFLHFFKQNEDKRKKRILSRSEKPEEMRKVP
jgi:hypothetical protein